MSVSEPNTVDGAGVDPETGGLVLLISDHLDWSDERGHLRALEAKISGYLTYLESGQAVELHPEAADLAPKIRVIFQHPPSEGAQRLLRLAGQDLSSRGVTFSTGMLPHGS